MYQLRHHFSTLSENNPSIILHTAYSAHSLLPNPDKTEDDVEGRKGEGEDYKYRCRRGRRPSAYTPINRMPHIIFIWSSLVNRSPVILNKNCSITQTTTTKCGLYGAALSSSCANWWLSYGAHSSAAAVAIISRPPPPPHAAAAHTGVPIQRLGHASRSRISHYYHYCKRVANRISHKHSHKKRVTLWHRYTLICYNGMALLDETSWLRWPWARISQPCQICTLHIIQRMRNNNGGSELCMKKKGMHAYRYE